MNIARSHQVRSLAVSECQHLCADPITATPTSSQLRPLHIPLLSRAGRQAGSVSGPRVTQSRVNHRRRTTRLLNSCRLTLWILKPAASCYCASYTCIIRVFLSLVGRVEPSRALCRAHADSSADYTDNELCGQTTVNKKRADSLYNPYK